MPSRAGCVEPARTLRGPANDRPPVGFFRSSVAFANIPTGATLGGTLSLSTSGGVASFTNLTINKIDSGCTLRVSSSGLTSATSNPINVTQNGKAPSALLASAPAASPAPDLSLAPLVLDSPDL